MILPHFKMFSSSGLQRCASSVSYPSSKEYFWSQWSKSTAGHALLVVIRIAVFEAANHRLGVWYAPFTVHSAKLSIKTEQDVLRAEVGLHSIPTGP